MAAYEDATSTHDTGDTVPAEETSPMKSGPVSTPNDGVGNGAASRVMVTVGAHRASLATTMAMVPTRMAMGWTVRRTATMAGSILVCNGTGITWSQANDRCVAAGYDGLGSFDSAAEHCLQRAWPVQPVFSISGLATTI